MAGYDKMVKTSTGPIQYLCSIEGILKIVELILGIISFALVVSHYLDEGTLRFSHYGFFILVSSIGWICTFLIVLFHLVGCCHARVYGHWTREYSLFIFMLSFSLSFFFFYIFGFALIAQWAEGNAKLIISTLIGVLLTICYLIDCVIFFKRVRRIREEEVNWEPGTSRA